ncbi:hypothetical protein ACF0H5_016742 [Mactra antiquata]
MEEFVKKYVEDIIRQSVIKASKSDELRTTLEEVRQGSNITNRANEGRNASNMEDRDTNDTCMDDFVDTMIQECIKGGMQVFEEIIKTTEMDHH